MSAHVGSLMHSLLLTYSYSKSKQHKRYETNNCIEQPNMKSKQHKDRLSLG